MTDKVLIIGHRGAPQDAKENTIASFQKAIEFGVDGVELDIHRTIDDYLIVVHNAEFSLPGEGTKYVFDQTFTHLKKWFPELPLLQDVFELCKNKVKIQVEIKRQDKKTIALLLDLVKDNGLENSVEIISFHLPVLEEIKRTNPTVSTGLIFPPFPEWMLDRHRDVTVLDAMDFIDADVAHLPITQLDSRLVKLVQRNGNKVQSSAVDDTLQIRKAVKLGVDQFATNNPRLAVKIVEEIKRVNQNGT